MVTHRCHQRGSSEGQGRVCPRRKQSRGVNGHVSLRNVTAVGGWEAYSVNNSNKCLKDKNNLNKIIVIAFFSER